MGFEVRCGAAGVGPPPACPGVFAFRLAAQGKRWGEAADAGQDSGHPRAMRPGERVPERV